MHRYVICYDVTDDKRRRLIVEALKDHGHRVQYSVFECNLDEKTLLKLQYRLQRLKDGGDSIMIYPLCANCMEKVIVMGQSRGEDEGLIL